MSAAAKSVLDVLVEARQLVLNGWTQNSTRRVTPSGYAYCAAGAVGACVESTSDARHDAVRVLHEVASERPGFDGWSVATWNDTPGRTLAEVVDLFDDAIDAEEGAWS